ncbi:MAG: hypothetical protein ACLFTK_09610 [Anaerolineales bacterium]
MAQDRQALIAAAEAIFNRALQDNAQPDTHALADLLADEPGLLAEMEAAFAAARTPTTFDDVRIDRVNAQFEAGYELLRQTFEPAVLDPRELYVAGLQTQRPDDSDFVMLARVWRCVGRHTYSPAGELRHFCYDPLSITESIVAVVVASYLTYTAPQAGQTVALGAISYLVTRPAFRRTAGHGGHLLALLEDALRARAQAQGIPLRGMMLESEDRARLFWGRQGFRYVPGSQYIQPPLHFDAQTGLPTSDTAQETFMVRLMDDAPHDRIARADLLAWLACMVDAWYDPHLANPQAQAQARQLIYKELLGVYQQSIAHHPDPLPLVDPNNELTA